MRYDCVYVVLALELNSNGGFRYQLPFHHVMFDLSFIPRAIESVLDNHVLCTCVDHACLHVLVFMHFNVLA